MKRKLPTTSKQWLREIRLAYEDAREAIPFGRLSGHPFTEAELFHLGPLVALKFRGRSQKGRDTEEIRETALATYLANSDPEGVDHGLESRPMLAFALTYISAHFSMGLLDEVRAGEILDYCDEHLVEE